ncbi:MAG: hypothetical protein EOM23_10065, partial [Candidatus Moranbacteria bacterium]|nr:hypothetical protein [Candidatus Moranbacteria bacterium]
MAKIVQNTKSYFIISKGQRRAILLLFVILILMIASYFLLPFYLKPDYQQVDSFAIEAAKFAATAVKSESEQRELTPFPFDPNTTTGEGFQQLGLSERQAEIILRYRNAGGKFRNADDFGKIFSISDEEFAILQPFIIIEPEVVPVKKLAKQPEKKALNPFPFNPNTIDSAGMTKMGLREMQIKNIINYRDAGGDFRVKKDLSKLFTISEEDYSILEKYILLPSTDSLMKAEEVTA